MIRRENAVIFKFWVQSGLLKFELEISVETLFTMQIYNLYNTLEKGIELMSWNLQMIHTGRMKFFFKFWFSYFFYTCNI